MSKYLGTLALVLVAVACGGSTDVGEESGGGTSQGGSADAGKGGGGAAGKATGGSPSSGGSIANGGRDAGGTPGFGGTIIVVGGYAGTGVGGTGVVDPRCPERQPMGACSDDATLACEYDFNGCLCYPAPGSFGFCQRVDPACPSAAAPPPDSQPGVGGFSTKVALPPKMTCRCAADLWACTYGP